MSESKKVLNEAELENVTAGVGVRNVSGKNNSFWQRFMSLFARSNSNKAFASNQFADGARNANQNLDGSNNQALNSMENSNNKQVNSLCGDDNNNWIK